MFYGVVSLAFCSFISFVGSRFPFSLAPRHTHQVFPPWAHPQFCHPPPTHLLRYNPRSNPPPSGCLLFAPLQRVLIAFVLQHTGETTAKAMAMPNGDGNGKFKAFYNNSTPPPPPSIWTSTPLTSPKKFIIFQLSLIFLLLRFSRPTGLLAALSLLLN